MRIKAQEKTGNSSGIEFFLHKKEETRKFRILNYINIPELNFRNPELNSGILNFFGYVGEKNLVSTMVLSFCTLRCKPMLTMGECVSAYLTVATVPTVPPFTAHS